KGTFTWDSSESASLVQLCLNYKGLEPTVQCEPSIPPIDHKMKFYKAGGFWFLDLIDGLFQFVSLGLNGLMVNPKRNGA
ncbi:MAG: hypothetical protein K0Q59_1445, partial [Paenibacillus sp.]|nr:hypothetical protein [Paenibacillus sp.]